MAKKFMVAIDLGGTNLKIAIVDLKYRIRYKKILDTQRFFKKTVLISAIVDSVKQIIKEKNLKRKVLFGVGLGLPGPVDVERGLVHFFPNIPGFKEVNLRSILQKKLRLPVFIDNDANLMALAEHKLGAGKGLNNLVCLTLGTGVGGGIIIAGRLYRGSKFAAGEIGHTPVNENGPSCNCGGRACLEVYIGNKRIIEQARAVFKRNISLEELSKLAKNKNKAALNIWLNAGRRLGIALSGAVNLLNPDGIVIGGGVANAGDFLFKKIRETISSRAMSVPAQSVKILKAKLGKDAGLIGAAILAKEGVSR